MSNLQKLSPDMPLKLASDTILRMLRARVHHHRQGQVKNSQSLQICVFYICYCCELISFWGEGKGWRIIVCI